MKTHRGGGEGWKPHLSVQACSHCDDASSLIVDGVHVGGWTLWVLRQDFVAQHPVCCFGVIFVNRCDRHYKGPYERDGYSINTSA